LPTGGRRWSAGGGRRTADGAVIRTDHRAHLQVTFEAQEKARKISERFAEWLWEDPDT